MITRDYLHFLIIISTVFIVKTVNVPIENIRVIKLVDFVENGSYLPVRNGEDFIIEVEGNPSTGYKWYLDNAEVVAKNKVLFPLNLDNKGSGQFYNSHKDNTILNGIYHFQFSAKKQGNEKLFFSYYKQSDKKINNIYTLVLCNNKKTYNLDKF